MICQGQKEILEKYIQLDREINLEIDQKLDKVFRWRAILEKITPVYSDIPGGGGSIHPKKEAIIAKIADLELEIDKKIDFLIDLREELEKIINNAGSLEQKEILMRKYIWGQSYQAIGDAIGYSKETIKRRNKEFFLKKIKVDPV